MINLKFVDLFRSMKYISQVFVMVLSSMFIFSCSGPYYDYSSFQGVYKYNRLTLILGEYDDNKDKGLARFISKDGKVNTGWYKIVESYAEVNINGLAKAFYPSSEELTEQTTCYISRVDEGISIYYPLEGYIEWGYYDNYRIQFSFKETMSRSEKSFINFCNR